MTQTHLARWSQRFGRFGSPCMTLATVDLPRDYAGKLHEGQTLAHQEEILGSPDLDGVRLNLTKGWNLDDARGAIERAHARGKIVMVDVVSRVRILCRTRSLFTLAPGQTICVYNTETLAANHAGLYFNLPVNLPGLEVDQPVVIRDGCVRGHVIAVNLAEGYVSIRIDWTTQGLAGLNRPPANFPDWTGSAWTFTPTDRAIVDLAVHCSADLLAISFAEEAVGVATVLHAVLDATKAASLPVDLSPVIVLKIETAAGLKNLPEMVKTLDSYEGGAAIEVARGDLAIEIALEYLGLAQEYCVQWGNARQVPVGVATGLLGSMQQRPDPSRAEVGDVWAALRTGARFLLLADETANDARYPIEAIEMLARLAQLGRPDRPDTPWWPPSQPHPSRPQELREASEFPEQTEST